MEVSLKVTCLPYAVGKQLSIPLINIGKKLDVKMMIFIHSSCLFLDGSK